MKKIIFLLIFELFINLIHACNYFTEYKPSLQCNSFGLTLDDVDEPLWRGFIFMKKGSGKYITHECKCGKNFERPYRSLRNGSHVHCSPECKKKYGPQPNRISESRDSIIITSLKYGEKTAYFDPIDYDLISRFTWAITKPKNLDLFYAQTGMKKPNGKWTTVSMHRLVMGVTDPQVRVDHKDHNGLNCRKDNMRICEGGQNDWNKSSNKDSSSKYLGVCKRVKKIKRKLKTGKTETIRWRASICAKGKRKELGAFLTEEAAAHAYDAAAKKLFKGFANLNFKE